MKTYIKERTLSLADFVLESKKTIRETAKVFHLSKSTVHNDLSKRLIKLDMKRYQNVKKILDFNFNEKHIRGGQSTKIKYQKKKYE